MLCSVEVRIEVVEVYPIIDWDQKVGTSRKIDVKGENDDIQATRLF